jgi:transcriptional repressor NrdR
MICPQCSNSNTSVLDSRDIDGDRVIRRRRECVDCKSRFSTYERVEVVNFVVIKKDGTREPYDRSKLEQGVWIAFGKRAKSRDVVVKLLDRLESTWGSLPEKEISTDNIGNDVLCELRKIDDIAFIRFASVCKKFKDIKAFYKELQKIIEEKE